MSDQPSAPGHAEDQPGGEPRARGTDEISAMMQAVMRETEKHREGGVDPDLEAADAEPGPGDA